MWKIYQLSLLVLVASAATLYSPNKVLSNQASILAENSANLAFKLYHKIAKETKMENILISPVVVASSLGLVALGGKASTASQVKTLLNVTQFKDKEFHAGLTELLTEVSDPRAWDPTWKISNHLYGPSSIKFVRGFVRTSKRYYNCDLSKINFRDKKNVVESINNWASKSTGGILRDVTRNVKNMDGAVIVNAMFFKPQWDEQFLRLMFNDRAFLLSHNQIVLIPMMHRKGIYGFYRDRINKLSVLSMPLAHKANAVFIMPHNVETLKRVERLLSKKQVDKWMRKLEQQLVAVFLPKMTMKVSHSLQKHLKNLGLTDAMDKSKADFSKISGKKNLYLSSLLHASAIEWDTDGNAMENDTEYESHKQRNPQFFHADHPFIFLVKDQKTSAILFMGRMGKPKGRKLIVDDNSRDEL